MERKHQKGVNPMGGSAEANLLRQKDRPRVLLWIMLAAVLQMQLTPKKEKTAPVS